MSQRNLLSKSDIQPLGEGVLSVLERVGILCQNREILQALEVKGAKVDYARETCKFPRKMQEAFLEELRREGPAGNGQGEFVAPPLPSLETQVAQFFYDYEKGERRSGNKGDFIDLIKLGDVLHPEEGVGHSLLLTDVPPISEPLEAAMLLAEYAHRPGPAFAWNVRQADYLEEMGRILGIDNWFTLGGICFTHPLRWDKYVADRFVRMMRAGQRAGLGAMPVAGVTAPVTVAGFVVVTSAEFLATWIAGRALNEDVPLGGVMYGGTMDVRTGAMSYSAFDALFYCFATVEFLRRWSNVEVPVGGGEYCDAKLPGLYAALEKAYKAMTIAAFTGQHPPIGQGMLDEGKTMSPVQLLLEREMGTGVRMFERSIEVTPETIALDTILDVGFGLDKNYLQARHTLKHYRDSLWMPEFIDRVGWNGFDDEKAMLDRTQRKVNDLISAYVKPEVDRDKLSKMREVVKRAQRELS